MIGTRRLPAVLIQMGKPPKVRTKRPPAPSVSRRRLSPDLTVPIVGEINAALERLGADEELLAIVELAGHDAG